MAQAPQRYEPSDRARQTLVAVEGVIQYWCAGSREGERRFLQPIRGLKAVPEPVVNGRRLEFFTREWWAQAGLPDLGYVPPTVKRPDYMQKEWLEAGNQILAVCALDKGGIHTATDRDMETKVNNGFEAVLNVKLARCNPRLAEEARRFIPRDAHWIHKLAFMLQVDAVSNVTVWITGLLGLRVLPTVAEQVKTHKENEDQLRAVTFMSHFAHQGPRDSRGDLVAAQNALINFDTHALTWPQQPDATWHQARTLLMLAITSHSTNVAFYKRVLAAMEEWAQSPHKVPTWPYNETIRETASMQDIVTYSNGKREVGDMMDMGGPASLKRPVVDETSLELSRPAQRIRQDLAQFDPAEMKLAMALSRDEMRLGHSDLAGSMNDRPRETAVAAASSSSMVGARTLVDFSESLTPRNPNGPKFRVGGFWKRTNDIQEIEAGIPFEQRVYAWRKRSLAPVSDLKEIPVVSESDLQEVVAPNTLLITDKEENDKRRDYYIKVKERVPPSREDQLFYDDLLQEEIKRINQIGAGEVRALHIPWQGIRSPLYPGPLREKLHYRVDGADRVEDDLSRQMATSIINKRIRLVAICDELGEQFERFCNIQASVDGLVRHGEQALQQEEQTLKSTAANILVARQLAMQIYRERLVLLHVGDVYLLSDPGFVQTDDPRIAPYEDKHGAIHEARIELDIQDYYKERCITFPVYGLELFEDICRRRIELRFSVDDVISYDIDLANNLRDNPNGNYDYEHERRRIGIHDLENQIMQLCKLRLLADCMQIGDMFSDVQRIITTARKIAGEFHGQGYADFGLNDDDDVDLKEFAEREMIYKDRPTPIQAYCSHLTLLHGEEERFVEEEVLADIDQMLFQIMTPQEAKNGRQEDPSFKALMTVIDDDSVTYMRELYALHAEFEVGIKTKRMFAQLDDSAAYNYIENRQYSTLSDQQRQVLRALSTPLALYSSRPSRALMFKSTFEQAWRIRLHWKQELKNRLAATEADRKARHSAAYKRFTQLEIMFGLQPPSFLPEKERADLGNPELDPRLDLLNAELTPLQRSLVEKVRQGDGKMDDLLVELHQENAQGRGFQLTERWIREALPYAQQLHAVVKETAAEAQSVEASELEEMRRLADKITFEGQLYRPQEPVSTNNERLLRRQGEMLWQIRQYLVRTMARAQAQPEAEDDESSDESKAVVAQPAKKGRKSKKPKRNPDVAPPREDDDEYDHDDDEEDQGSSSAMVIRDANVDRSLYY